MGHDLTPESRLRALEQQLARTVDLMNRHIVQAREAIAAIQRDNLLLLAKIQALETAVNHLIVPSGSPAEQPNAEEPCH